MPYTSKKASLPEGFHDLGEEIKPMKIEMAGGDGFRLKINRDANNASDTMVGDAELIAVEVQQVA